MASTSDLKSVAGDYYNYTVSATGGGGAGSISIGAAGATTAQNYYTGAGWSSNTISTTVPTIKIEGTAEIDGDLTIQGHSMSEWMAAVDKRLAILVPDPAKLAHFEALRKAYDNYKMLEALCEIPVEDDE